MSPVVVDTNVGVAANGDANIDTECQLACIEKLEHVMNDGVVALDDDGLIFNEYQAHFSFAGGPRVGDAFFKHLYDLQHHGKKVRRIAVTPCDDHERGFEELPKNSLDASDRKFLAVAVQAGAAIINATDSDWQKEQNLLVELGVEVEELCPHLPWFHRADDGMRART